MKNKLSVLLGSLLVCGAVLLWANYAEQLVNISISPKVVVLKSKTTQAVTVHADIGFALVNGSTVCLSDIPASAVFADDRGDLVAKFDMEMIKALLAPPQTSLTLTGTLKDNTTFIGYDTVEVR